MRNNKHFQLENFVNSHFLRNLNVSIFQDKAVTEMKLRYLKWQVADIS